VTTSYLDEVTAALGEVSEQFMSLVQNASNPDQRVPKSPEWTIKDVTAHVTSVVPRFSLGPQGAGEWAQTPGELPELNQRQGQALADLSVDQLVQTQRSDLKSLLDQIRGYGDAPPVFGFHGGASVGADIALGILLGEFVVHGWDIARATSRPWPIRPRHAELILRGVDPVLPGFVNRSAAGVLTATFRFKMRGQGTHVYSFVNGRLDVNPGTGRKIDAHISAEPVAALLVLYQRESQWKHIAMGRMLAWGRKPWLALTLVNRFYPP
jgi:uncharacterized protein (TIGR03083 family)